MINSKIDFRKQTETDWLMYVVIAVLAVITLYPIANVGLVVGDDLEYFVHSHTPERWGLRASVYAKDTGRFTLLLTQWIFYVPYLIDSKWYLLFMRAFPILMSFALFVWFVKRIAKSNRVALILSLICCSFFPILGNYSATVSYPFYFMVSFSLILLSLNLMMSYFEGKGYYWLLISSFVFLLALLFYESYLMYCLLFGIMIIGRYGFKDLKVRSNRVQLVKELFPFIAGGVIFLSVYLVYYNLHPTTYPGNQIADKITLGHLWTVLCNMFINSFPFVDFKAYDHILRINNGWYRWYDLSMIAYLKGLIVGLAFYFVARGSRDLMGVKMAVKLFVVSMFFVLIPHLPLALTEKYLSMYVVNVYVTTSFAFFAVMVVFLSVYCLAIGLAKKKNWLRLSIIVIFAIIVGVCAAMIQDRNERMAHDLSLSQKRFEMINYVMDSDLIENGDVVYLGQLNFTSSINANNITTCQPNSWNSYIRKVSDKKMRYFADSYNSFYADFKNDESKVKLVLFSQAYSSGDALMAVCLCSGRELTEDWKQLRVDNIRVVYRSESKRFGVSVLNTFNDTVRMANINAERINNLNITNLYFEQHPEFCEFEIVGEGLIPATLSVNCIPFQEMKFNYINH